VTPTEALQDVLARVVWIREAIETGEVGIAHTLLLDLERDVAETLVRDRERQS
jgi:hypothetical protein